MDNGNTSNRLMGLKPKKKQRRGHGGEAETRRYREGCSQHAPSQPDDDDDIHVLTVLVTPQSQRALPQGFY